MSFLDLALEELHELYNDPLPPVPVPEAKPKTWPRRKQPERGWTNCKECGEPVYIVPRTERNRTTRSKRSDPLCPHCNNYYDGNHKSWHFCVNVYKEVQP